MADERQNVANSPDVAREIDRSNRRYLIYEFALNRLLNKQEQTQSDSSFLDLFSAKKWREARRILTSKRTKSPLGRLIGMITPVSGLIEKDKAKFQEEVYKELEQEHKETQDKIDEKFKVETDELAKQLERGNITKEQYDELFKELENGYKDSKVALDENFAQIKANVPSLVEKYGVKLKETGSLDEASKDFQENMSKLQKEVNGKEEYRDNIRNIVKRRDDKVEVQEPLSVGSTISDEIFNSLNTSNAKLMKSVDEIRENTTELVTVVNKIAKVQQENVGKTGGGSGLGLVSGLLALPLLKRGYGFLGKAVSTVLSVGAVGKAVDYMKHLPSKLTVKTPTPTVPKNVPTPTGNVNLPPSVDTKMNPKGKPSGTMVKQLSKFAPIIKGAGLLGVVASGAYSLYENTNDYRTQSNQLEVMEQKGEVTKEEAEKVRRNLRAKAFVKTVTGIIPFVGDDIGNYISEKISDDSVKNVFDKTTVNTNGATTIQTENANIVNKADSNQNTVLKPSESNRNNDVLTPTNSVGTTTYSGSNAQSSSNTANVTNNNYIDNSTKVASTTNTSSGQKVDFCSFNRDKSLANVRKSWKV